VRTRRSYFARMITKLTMCVITGLGGSLQGEAEFASLSKD